MKTFKELEKDISELYCKPFDENDWRRCETFRQKYEPIVEFGGRLKNIFNAIYRLENGLINVSDDFNRRTITELVNELRAAAEGRRG